MKNNNKLFGFKVSIIEFPNIIKNLWDIIKQFYKDKEQEQNQLTMSTSTALIDKDFNQTINIEKNNTWIWPFINPDKNSLLSLISDDNGNTHNGCYFLSNFQLVNLDLFKNSKYQEIFNYLDKKGGFFNNLWTNDLIHSILSILLINNKFNFTFFEDFGYRFEELHTCPFNLNLRLKNKCFCDYPNSDITFTTRSCISRFYNIMDYDLPMTLDQFTERMF